ncbi:MAG: SIMPL domain-containing protein [Candidatus Kryptoniota bacterium]
MPKLFTLFFLVTLLAAESNAQSQSEITVSAEATVYAKPGIADFSLTIVARQPKATEAFATYLERYHALVQSLRDVIDTTTLMTNDLTISPSFDSKNPDQVSPNYYQLWSSMSISVPISKLNNTLSRIASIEGVTINGIAFRVRNLDSLETIALKEAVTKAHDKAEEIAKLEGFTNIKLRSMNPSYYHPPVPLRGEVIAAQAQMSSSVNPSTISAAVDVSATYTAY